jgi:hypothetical protein
MIKLVDLLKEIEEPPRQYFDKIPIEPGKYYRITGMSEIKAIRQKGKLETDKDKAFYDNQILNQIANASNIPIGKLEDLNGINNNEELRKLYTKYVAEPAKKRGEVVLAPRAKSNHGEIGFVKEGFFYNLSNSSRLGSPVIVGDERNSKFQAGFHGNYQNKYNIQIGRNKPAILIDGFDGKDFEYYLYEKGKGYYKLTFDELKQAKL